MSRRKTGRITFVGAGPGDPGLLTVRAAETIRGAEFVLVDPDVPTAVTELAGPDAEVRPALGDPAAVAATLVAEAKTRPEVVRLVAGDPLTADAVVRETLAVAKAGVPFDLVPGVPAGVGVPAYAGVPVGSAHAVADARDEVDWSGFAAAPGTLVLTATAPHLGKIAAALVEQGRADDTPVAVTADGTGPAQQTVDTTLAGMETDGAALTGPLVVTVGPAVLERDRLSWWESRPLYGWRVLVPRTKEQAGAMSARLRAYGAVPVEVPTIAVEPPRTPAQMERAIKGLVTGRYEWIVFTSTNAVRAVREKFDEFGLDARAFAGVKIACVGESTASAVRDFGIRPELLPSGEQSSEGLLEDFPPYDEVLDPIDRVLLPRADIATETLAAGLRERGWEIDDVTAYRTVRAAPPPADIRDAIKSGGFDAVCFTSSSTVRNLVGIAGKPHARTVVACIGPQTAATAREFGLRSDVEPEVAAVDTLVDALAAHAAAKRASGDADPAAEEVEAGDGADPVSFPVSRPRRLRRTPALRRLVSDVRVHPSDLILPLFVKEGIDQPAAVASMPGVQQHTLESVVKAAYEAVSAGVGGLILFGIPSVKDGRGSGADDPAGIVQLALGRLAAEVGDATVLMTDLCLDEYTDHGHCGVLLPDGSVDNDATLARYADIAIAQATAGAHVVAPSGMMDGQVGAIRSALDGAGFADVAVLAYAAKYASAFYGPFRDAAECAPQFGDRAAYQQDPARSVGDALREVALDVAEGADAVMVKPALAYLDVVAAVRAATDLPLAAYQVSGEYAMVEAAAARGWIDRDRIIAETLTAAKRAGADMILTYWATEVARAARG